MSEYSEWDERRVQIGELDSGPGDPFPEFAEEIRALMEQAGNEVGRPCVMKVTIEVADGQLKRKSENDESADENVNGGDRDE